MTRGWRGGWIASRSWTGGYRLDDGAWREAFLPFLPAIGVMALWAHACGTGIQRERLPVSPAVWLDGLKTLVGRERIQARPSVLCRDDARMPLVGFHAQPVRDGVGQRGAPKRPAAREPGPIGPDTLANTMVKWPVRDLQGVCQGALRALATAGVCGPKGTGMREGPELEPTERSTGCGQVTRPGRMEETRGQGHASEVTVDGGNVLLVIEAVTKIPLAVQGGKRQAHATHGTRAWGTQARAKLAGDARRHQSVFEQGCLAGPARWWLDQPGLCVVVPANATMAVPADARAHGPSWAGPSRPDRTAGDRGRGHEGTDHR